MAIYLVYVLIAPFPVGLTYLGLENFAGASFGKLLAELDLLGDFETGKFLARTGH